METQEVTVIRFKQSQTTIYCAKCQKQTRHFSVLQAVSILSLSETEILHLMINKKIHFSEISKDLFLCGYSLATLIQE